MYKERLKEVQNWLKKERIAAILVSKEDAHQGEEILSSEERLLWLTNFSGSAGYAVVGQEKASLFVDGRYHLQAAQEVDQELFSCEDRKQGALQDWIRENLKEGNVFAIDGAVTSVAQMRSLKTTLTGQGATLSILRESPLHQFWQDRPIPKQGLSFVHPKSFAGQDRTEKWKDVRTALQGKSLFLSLPDSIAWLLNIRGSDLTYTPSCLSFCLLTPERLVWFVEGQKVTDQVSHVLKDVEIVTPSLIEETLKQIEGEILFDAQSLPVNFLSFFEEAGLKPIAGKDPCQLLKACKNTVELSGIKKAHEKDALAMVRFLAWFERQYEGKEESDLPLTELSCVAKLLAFRQEGEGFYSDSFETIAGAGANGAIVHYSVDHKSNAVLEEGNLFLLDSGGQYSEGTTDITRTLLIGDDRQKPQSEQLKKDYTAVLKGMISLTMARFPVGTTGAQLDVFARAPLWKQGLDYAHGTGHGVGAFLGVHEGPVSFSPKAVDAQVRVGMVLSNEPGCYRAGQYGIRLENLLFVRPCNKEGFLSFETLTQVPFDPRLIIWTQMTQEERSWLKEYHKSLCDLLYSSLEECDPQAAQWLLKQTDTFEKA